MSIPAGVDELTPEWFTKVLSAPIDKVEVIDAHSGTTGRARVALRSPADVPETVFVKLQPFVEEQRKFLRQIGLGVAEARLYATVGNELPVRAPRVWHADHDSADGSFVMVLEDLEASGCHFPSPSDDGILSVAESLVAELAVLHATYAGQDLGWLRTPSGMRRKPEDTEIAARRAQFIVSAVEQFADEMPAAFRRLGDLYAERSLEVVALFNEGERTLIHGDTHSGNLFVDRGRCGFFDWAVAGRGPGMRDVAYFLCNSLPIDMRRAEEAALLARYRGALADEGTTLDEHTAHEQYRLFSVYSWIAAASTAAMGSRWQPIDVSRAAMVSTTQAIEDLDAVGLLEERLG
ncbi:phosphotransferase [Mycolicibacterium pulveris]|uniref:Phosphotransferase n=1 Tax=Mycolicibacterium pulveris TaxID=36813 RepID=A0A7I7UE66_MYCPV|nr:phosphotransferase [Mycolicibacterium pulveris]MCV6981859.1 phosphotransferase [Mycolicibacterium pulveris]BBY79141.1 phosphotransferase [Mycolicibacterium pulveris]